MKLFGIDIRVATNDECDAVELVICGNVSHFTDDVRTSCAACGAAIVHRPYVPARPPKVCMSCAVDMVGSTKH